MCYFRKPVFLHVKLEKAKMYVIPLGNSKASHMEWSPIHSYIFAVCHTHSQICIFKRYLVIDTHQDVTVTWHNGITDWLEALTGLEYALSIDTQSHKNSRNWFHIYTFLTYSRIQMKSIIQKSWWNTKSIRFVLVFAIRTK